jgi:hypothetical protein
MGLYDDASKRVGSGLFLKLEPGDTRLRILAHPYVSNRQFREGDPFRTVFTWPVWNYDLGQVQVLEQGKSVFKGVAACVKHYGETMPMECDLVVTKAGSGLETSYSIVPVPKAGTMPEWAKVKEEMKKINLAEISKGIPFEQFAGGSDAPGVKAAQAAETAAPAKPARSTDVVLDELPEGQDAINLEDIPF